MASAIAVDNRGAPALKVRMASTSVEFANVASGFLDSLRETTFPSKQSTMTDR